MTVVEGNFTERLASKFYWLKCYNHKKRIHLKKKKNINEEPAELQLVVSVNVELLDADLSIFVLVVLP